MIASTEILLRMIDEAFDRKSWHGTNLKGSIRGLSASAAAWRPSALRHNIWEITLHAAYWKYAVRRRLLGEKRGSFPLPGSNWFKRPDPQSGHDVQWKADVALLTSVHEGLRAAISALSAGDLPKAANGGSTLIISLVTGIAAHDLYHAGQIQLLKRMYDEHADTVMSNH